jgi:hypothetical protein
VQKRVNRSRERCKLGVGQGRAEHSTAEQSRAEPGMVVVVAEPWHTGSYPQLEQSGDSLLKRVLCNGFSRSASSCNVQQCSLKSDHSLLDANITRLNLMVTTNVACNRKFIQTACQSVSLPIKPISSYSSLKKCANSSAYKASKPFFFCCCPI